MVFCRESLKHQNLKKLKILRYLHQHTFSERKPLTLRGENRIFDWLKSYMLDSIRR